MESTHIASERRVVSCDEEAWVKERLDTLCRTALTAKSQFGVRADEKITNGAIAGAINGAAVEIIKTLGLDPAYVNLSKGNSKDFV